MTDNMKKFLEAVSQNKECIEMLKKAETQEAVIALAAENGFTLTQEDLKQEPASGGISDDELEAVAGGKTCGCAIGGGGASSGDQGGCGCWLGGVGAMNDDSIRCVCAVGGGGEGHPI